MHNSINNNLILIFYLKQDTVRSDAQAIFRGEIRQALNIAR